MQSKDTLKRAYAALLEASNLFDNYPQTLECIGTYQVVHEALDDLRAALTGTEATSWTYDIEPGGATQAVICEPDGTVVAYIHALGGSTGHKALERNVRLMAAAPDLFAALQALLDDQRDASLPVLAQARAALSRAVQYQED